MSSAECFGSDVNDKTSTTQLKIQHSNCGVCIVHLRLAVETEHKPLAAFGRFIDSRKERGHAS